MRLDLGGLVTDKPTHKQIIAKELKKTRKELEDLKEICREFYKAHCLKDTITGPVGRFWTKLKAKKVI